jgi:uncharacterized protein YmfQ (DUF2313 family)
MVDLLPSAPLDRHVRRTGDDYVAALFALLPRGRAWARQLSSTMGRVVDALARFWGYVDGRAADLLERESDPQRTVELLPEWERAYGLPDPCFPESDTVGERQRMLVTKITWMGGQSRQYFIDVMAWLGFDVKIQEWAPFMAGVSRVGDTRPPSQIRHRWYLGRPENRFVWTAQVANIGLVWFRCASGRCGTDPHLQFRMPFDLECLLRRWKPAHTRVIFDYSGLGFPDDPFAGTQSRARTGQTHALRPAIRRQRSRRTLRQR